MSRPPAADPDVVLAGLVHALEVHQVELEIQNHELVTAIDELRRSNAALELACDRYRVLYDLAPVALITMDRSGTLREVNEAAVVMLGAPREHILLRRFAAFAVEADRRAVGNYVAALFSDGGAQDREVALNSAAATPRRVRMHGAVLREAGPARAVISIVDVTALHASDLARRDLDRRAEQRHRLESLAILAGGVAHDFDELLAVVIASAEQAIDGLGSGSPVAEPLGDAYRAARAAGRLAHRMLGYSDRVSMSTYPTDCARLIRELSPGLRSLASTTPLVIDVADSLPWICCDPAQIRDLLNELVRNAIEAMSARPGAVEILCRAAELPAASIPGLVAGRPLVSGMYLVLEVRDAGAGMNARTRARVLAPLFSTKFVDRGLGLAVASGIVRGHHGGMTIESAVDVGTTVRVYIPAVPAPAPPIVVLPPARQRPTRSRVSGTVLLVDDDPDVRRALSRTLSHLGLTVVTAADGFDAVDRFHADAADIDVVLMDLMMPRMDGIAAAAAIQALRPRVPLVLMTALREVPEEAHSMFVATLTKPFDVGGLRELIGALLSP